MRQVFWERILLFLNPGLVLRLRFFICAFGFGAARRPCSCSRSTSFVVEEIRSHDVPYMCTVKSDAMILDSPKQVENGFASWTTDRPQMKSCRDASPRDTRMNAKTFIVLMNPSASSPGPCMHYCLFYDIINILVAHHLVCL